MKDMREAGNWVVLGVFVYDLCTVNGADEFHYLFIAMVRYDQVHVTRLPCVWGAKEIVEGR